MSCGHAAPFWRAVAHVAPCGLPCIGGGVRKPRESHGYLDRCPTCGPLRVLPDVVTEMSERVAAVERLMLRATSLRDTGHSRVVA